MLGRRLLHYRVIEAIGQGGMSVVYRGRDEHLARDVAIKVLHPFLAEKPECRVRLAREARAVARLAHPNILQVFDFSGERPTLNEKGINEKGRDDGGYWPHEGFIIAELVKGPTLKRFGEKHALWRVPEVGALVVWQLLQALQHAHDHGIVHRDLKPENVMVRDDGTLKLMDFGIAQIADQGGLTVTGTLLGSPAHMAPECIDGHPADERSDLFSMGTILYWITTGSLPFEALTPHALLKQIVDGRSVPAQQKAPRISDDLARVINRSLATKPADRYATARDFGDALKEVLEKAGLAVDDVAVRQILNAPPDHLARITATVREAFLQRARGHLEGGQTARAFGCLNRVLADNAADEDARALLDKLQDEPNTLDAIAEEDAREAEAAALALAASGASAAASSSSSSSSPPLSSSLATTNPGSPSRAPALLTAGPAVSEPAPMRWQTLFVGVAAVGLVAMAVVVARAVDDAVERPGSAGGPPLLVEGVPPAGPPSPPAVGDPVDSSPGQPGAFNEPGDDGRPRAGRRPVRSVIDVTTPRPLPTLPAQPGPPVATGSPTSVDTPPRATRRVVFRVKPWADIIVDGVVLAKGTMSHEAELAEGPHRVVFVNPRAKEHDVPFTVSLDGPPPLVTARLEPRPALLVVRANVADAFVDVEGVGKAAGDTIARPLVVSLDEQSKTEREVFVYKKGFSAYRRRHTFTAGETLELDVLLEPDPGDTTPPDPKP